LNLEQQILQNCHTIAVVGLSSNPLRPSFEVAGFMQRHGYRIIPVNPQETEVLGEKCYARLEDIPEKVDCVDVFRRPEHVPAIVDSAIAIGAKAVWLQLGIVHDEAIARAETAGLQAVQDRCMLIEYKRYFR
jgi:predicted CoA-binding protein